MYFGPNIERRAGLNDLGRKLARAHFEATTTNIEANVELYNYAGERPIADLSVAQKLAKPVEAAVAFQTATGIYVSLIENHQALAADLSTPELITELEQEYNLKEGIGLAFGRYPSIVRKAIYDGKEIGKNRILKGLSRDDIPLSIILELPRSHIDTFTSGEKETVLGRTYLFSTSITGLSLGIRYVGESVEHAVLYQEQLDVLGSLQN